MKMRFQLLYPSATEATLALLVMVALHLSVSVAEQNRAEYTSDEVEMCDSLKHWYVILPQ